MKWNNKSDLKKYLGLSLIVIVVGIFLFSSLLTYEHYLYNKNYNKQINSFINVIKENYPEVSEEKIINILNSKNISKVDYLKNIGIDVDKDILILENAKNLKTFAFINIFVLVGIFVVLLFIFLLYEKKKTKDILEIIHLIEEINKKNYELKITDNSEDEFSILKNEIYKTTIMLKEAAENSRKDKFNLKKSLEDISHQLKTPLTSILIMLDNILENREMDKKSETYFINSIRREITNINFLVQSLLKLSKFDVNCINFNKNDILVKDIIRDVVQNVSMLCDLKNIKIKGNIPDNIFINCDKKWQIEALTNVVKNCIEYSYENSEIILNVSQNGVSIDL